MSRGIIVHEPGIITCHLKSVKLKIELTPLFIINSFNLKVSLHLVQRCARGISRKSPVIENLAKSPCPAKPDPLSRQIFRVFREFSGKFRVF